MVQERDWLDHLAAEPASRSTTRVCIKFADAAVEGLDDNAQLALVKKIDSLLDAEDAAYDIAGYRDAPPGLRTWCGATVDAADHEDLGPWLVWAGATTRTLVFNEFSDIHATVGSNSRH